MANHSEIDFKGTLMVEFFVKAGIQNAHLLGINSAFSVPTLPQIRLITLPLTLNLH
jgi:hypothetical protein